jgi:pimeloyl-ACP methyl ester carboxylesterase
VNASRRKSSTLIYHVTIVFLHGTRWSLTGQVFRLEQLRDFGFSVLAIDYRGFGKSDGDLPSEKTVYEDAHAAWERNYSGFRSSRRATAIRPNAVQLRRYRSFVTSFTRGASNSICSRGPDAASKRDQASRCLAARHVHPRPAC